MNLNASPCFIKSFPVYLKERKLVLLSIPNILLVFNLNFNSASINEMTMLNSKKNYKKSNEIFQNSIIFTIINIFFFSLLLFFLYFFKDFEFIVLKNIKYDELTAILNRLPNLPAKDVPLGNDEKSNLEIFW